VVAEIRLTTFSNQREACSIVSNAHAIETGETGAVQAKKAKARILVEGLVAGGGTEGGTAAVTSPSLLLTISIVMYRASVLLSAEMGVGDDQVSDEMTSKWATAKAAG
jgi:tRNA(Ile2) C34 agmatinyltransferase TiaS